MEQSLFTLNDQIKREADQLVYEKGLSEILQRYGTPHVSGSYELDLMTWRDLDIYLEVKEFSEREFFLMGAEISTKLRPIKMQFRNELIAQTIDLPLGLYWGVYLGNERAGAWKLDIWCVNPEECRRLLNYCTAIKNRLTPEAKIDIMNIKSQCWEDPRYRRQYTSADIYKAVLDNGVRTLEDFRQTLLKE